MNKFIFLVLTISCSWIGQCHELKMASFQIKEEAKGLKITIQLDKGAIFKVLQIQEKSSKDFYADRIENYLLAHMDWVINDSCVSVLFSEVKDDQDIVYVKGFLSYPPDQIQTLEIQNTCLVEEEKNHRNVVTFQMKDQFRGFEMDRRRTDIKVVF